MHLHTLLDQLKPQIGASVSVSRIEQALTNACYRLKSPLGKFALRVNNPTSQRFGIDRSREQAVLTVIADQPFAPSLIEVSEHWLLSRWCSSQPQDVANNPEALLTLLTQVRNTPIPPTLKPLLVSEQILHLSAHQQSPLPKTVVKHIQRLCAQYRPPQQLPLCFHDWHSGNLLGTDEQPILIDWEYAAPGDPAIDLACLCQGMQLSNTQSVAMAQAFDFSEERWREASRLTQLMSALWYGVRFKHPFDATILKEMTD